MTRHRTLRRIAAIAAPAILVPMVTLMGPPASGALGTEPDAPTSILTQKAFPEEADGAAEDEEGLQKLEDAYYTTRFIGGDGQGLTLEQASALRTASRGQAAALRKSATVSAAPNAVAGPWGPLGPNPIVQIGRTTGGLEAVSGRISALAVRNDGTIILGAAAGGVWTYDSVTGTWIPRSADSMTQTVGALAIAPSNDSVVYLGSGEGALSGDSVFGDGVYKSTDGGVTWAKVSGSYFRAVSTSHIVVDPTNADHLYVAVLRGRGGARRVTPPNTTAFGIFESTDGGSTWTPRLTTTDQFRGATDLVMDPQNPAVLYTSLWGDQIYKTTNGGASWTPFMAGLPTDGAYADSATRFSLGLSHPAGQDAVLYTGFQYFDNGGTNHPSRVWKSVNGGSFALLPHSSGVDDVQDYCATQCFYDNVVLPDPTNANTIYLAGQYNYGIGSGGIYRSDDGGQTWKNLGLDLHPDFHAVALQPTNTSHVVIGNDGGVWQSSNKGGRLSPTDTLANATWENLNGTVVPNTGAVLHRTGLQITQFTSIAASPATTPGTASGRFWGGSQDNGTERKSVASASWFDQAGGDGGQVLVDPNNDGYVFGTYFGISPYRFQPNTALSFNGNFGITSGINLKDRAEFYIPWVMNKANPNQLFLGTYRLYRTNNAETANAADVRWAPISGDLTSGCPGTAPNGARGCFISAVGVADGGDGVYTGADDGYVYVSDDAVSAATPTWRRADNGTLPARPVTQFAVDRSNWRTAYISYAGYDAATKNKPGHVFVTFNGGQSWKNVSGNLPDTPVNSVVLDPSYPNTLYVGTDVGPYVTTNGGVSWSPLGASIPLTSVWQLDLDPSHRTLSAGTHGRGAYLMTDNTAAPALIVSKVDDGSPVGPGSTIHYTITVRNVGNAPANGVTITDRIPVGTSFVSASNGGSQLQADATWTNLSVPAGGSTSVHLDVRIDSGFTGTSIVDDRLNVTASGGFGTSGSPHTTPIAPAHKVTLSPATQTDGARPGQSVTYPLHVTNGGYLADSYTMSATGAWTSAVLDSTCTTPVGTTASVAAGATLDLCVRVTVPASGVTNDQANATTVTATSTADAAVSSSATVTTLAVTADVLLVDGDGNIPDVSAAYKDAVAANGVAYGYWDLAADPALPSNYLKAHTSAIWWTGNAYPGPVTPYESELAGFLDGGGRLLMSGQDILDQAAGTTDFVKSYLHISWDGTERQNDKNTATVTSVAGNPVSDGIGTVPLDHAVLGAAFEDQITPIAPATPAFTDATSATDALTVAAGAYKVVFLAFPLESYGSAAQKADLAHRALTYFGP
jgi:uncharacterized repeat protein (TIGR01451 family)